MTKFTTNILDILPQDVLSHILDLSATATCQAVTPIQSLAQLTLTCKTFHHLINATPSHRYRMKEQERQHNHLRNSLITDGIITYEDGAGGSGDIVVKLTFQTHLQLIQRYRRVDSTGGGYVLTGLTGRLTIPHPTEPNSQITMIYPDELDATLTNNTNDLITILAPSRIKDDNLISLYMHLHQIASLTMRHHDAMGLPPLSSPAADFLANFQKTFLTWKQQNARRIYHKNGFIPQTFKSTKQKFNNQRVFTNRQGATFVKSNSASNAIATIATHQQHPFANLFVTSRFSRVVLGTSI